jgi:hypothetical protein
VSWIGRLERLHHMRESFLFSPLIQNTLLEFLFSNPKLWNTSPNA